MPTPSNYGTDYSRFYRDDGQPVPFPNPINDAQRQANARARAERAGQPIGSGYLNPKGTLEDPNDEPWYLDPRIVGPLAVGASAGVGALGAAGGGGGASVIPGTGIPTVSGTGVGVTAPASLSMPAAGASGVIPGTGIPTVGGTGVGVTTPTAAGTIAGTTAAGTSAIDKLRRSLTSAQGAASLASLLPALIATARSGGNGSGGGAGSDELARIQAITEARMRRADPLHQVAVQLAFNRAPISARNGISLQNVPLPQ